MYMLLINNDQEMIVSGNTLDRLQPMIDIEVLEEKFLLEKFHFGKTMK
jgi:hypothetical protein